MLPTSPSSLSTSVTIVAETPLPYASGLVECYAAPFLLSAFQCWMWNTLVVATFGSYPTVSVATFCSGCWSRAASSTWTFNNSDGHNNDNNHKHGRG
mmetsp:Transcript_59398/g.117718  ORF Transcript_59398/g.117718 Transcript_59398/m.117718 type:complete len:97 (+) Transcript_59398:49-339(+)